LPTNDLSRLQLDLSGGTGGKGTNGVAGQDGTPATAAQLVITPQGNQQSTIGQLLAPGGNQFIGISLAQHGNVVRFTRSEPQ